MYIFFIILVVLLIVLPLLIIPIRLRLMAHLDAFGDRKGFYSIRIFDQPVLSGIIDLEGNRLILTKHKCKRTRIKLTFNPADEESIVNYLDNTFLSIVDIRRLYLYFNAGKADDAAFSAMAVITGKIAIQLLLRFLRQKYPRMDYLEGATTDMQNDALSFTIDSILTISLADIIYSIIYAKVLANRKKAKNQKKEQKYVFSK